MDESMVMNRVHPSLADKLYRDAVEIDEDSDEISDERFVRLRVRPSFRAEVEGVYREVYANARERAMSEVASVKLVALPEALKVRVISKGPPLTYFTLKPVQKFLLRQMRRLRAFKLVGETVTPEFLEEAFKGVVGIFTLLIIRVLQTFSIRRYLESRLRKFVILSVCHLTYVSYFTKL